MGERARGRKSAIGAALSFVFLLSGCGVVYHFRREHILRSAAQVDFGPPPPPNHVRQEVTLLEKRLNSPVQFEPESTGTDVIRGGYLTPKALMVWISPVQVKGKGLYKFAWKDGKIAAILSPDGREFQVRPGSWYYTDLSGR